MRYAVDPRQMELFDLAAERFSKVALKKLRGDWPAIFRSQILHLMPAEQAGKHFHATLGCPTKELYSMVGLIFLKESNNLTVAEAVDKYMFDIRYQFALNVCSVQARMCEATYYRYQKLFLEDDIAAEIFNDVTNALIESLELDISRQRLDSTHLYSDMATFGRTRLMGVAIKRFLTSLRRHERESYDAIDSVFTNRYVSSQSRLFADWKKNVKALRQSVAEDLLFLVEHFAKDEKITNRDTYKAMVRILEEQCDVDSGKVVVKSKTGGDVMQNPSDEDATYDGHKGPGYQAQISETCSADNEEQFVVGCIPQTASDPDSEAVKPVLDQLEAGERMPESALADGAYGSDENVEHAKERGVDLQSPVSGTPDNDAYAMNIDDFAVNEKTEKVESCPAGNKPVSSVHNTETGETRTTMNARDCFACDCQKECPVQNMNGEFVVSHTAKRRRIDSRRREQDTEAFRDNYRIRSGGESVNSGLKRKTGLGKLRRRGMPAVRMSVFLKVAGWNIFRAVSILRKRGIDVFQACFCANRGLVRNISKNSLIRAAFFHFRSIPILIQSAAMKSAA